MPVSNATPHLTLGVIGAGYVGLVSAVGFAQLGLDVEVVETEPSRLAALRQGRVPFSEAGVQEALSDSLAAGRLRVLGDLAACTADILLVCVGTPIDDSGHADMRAVEGVLADLVALERHPVVVIRSTLPVGTCRRLIEAGAIPDLARFILVPEFLRQGAALKDFTSPSRVVIGRHASVGLEAETRVRRLFEAFDAPVAAVSLEEAELIKNGSNAFLALKISFANEMAALAERAGADAGPVLAGIGLDPRIGSAFLGPSFGFGGSCLPKELATIASAGRERGLEMHVTSAAAEANSAQQLRFARRIDQVAGGVAGRPVALLGLAFKAGTDDIRSSPAVALAAWLMERGAIVRAYDPEAASRTAQALPTLDIRATAMEALDGAEVAVIATEWPEFATLDWASARDRMARPVVVDGRRHLDPDRMREMGFWYERVGTPSPEPAASG